MKIDQSIQTPNVSADNVEKLDPAKKIKLQKAVREFESIFVGYMLKSMRNTVQKADNTTDDFGADMLESMFDGQLAEHISKNSHLGLAEMLYRKMSGGDSLPRTGRVNVLQSSQGASPGAAKADGTATVASDGRAVDSLNKRLQNYSSYITEASQKFGVSDSLIKAVIASESAAKPDAQSAKNAKGLMQLIDSTADELGVKDVWDPRQNIMGGAKYLKRLLDKFDGNEQLAVASYNAGPDAVEKHGGVPPYRETQTYVARVLSLSKIFEQQGESDE